jgi:hypothetical protein
LLSVAKNLTTEHPSRSQQHQLYLSGTRHPARRREKRNIILRNPEPDIILKKTKQVDGRTPSEFPEKKAGQGGGIL